MIKIKLSDPNNMKSFSGFIHTRELLREYSIEITDSNDYDYEFIHANEFVNTNLPLQQSIDMGLENLSKKTSIPSVVFAAFDVNIPLGRIVDISKPTHLSDESTDPSSLGPRRRHVVLGGSAVCVLHAEQ